MGNPTTQFPSLKELKTIIGEKWHRMEEFVEVLYFAITLKENVVFYGRGGHGKSECAQAVLTAMGIWEETFRDSWSENTSVDTLFGGMDIPALQAGEGEKFLLDRSMFNYKYAMIDEAWDAERDVIAALKDPLQSGEVRKGAQQMKSKLQTLIVLTNKDKSYLDRDHSIEALKDRFFYWHRTEWDNDDYRNRSEWQTMLSKQFPSADTSKIGMMCGTAVKIHSEGGWISPRLIVKATKILTNSIGGMDAIKHNDELKPYIEVMLEEQDRAKEAEKIIADLKQYEEKYELAQKAFHQIKTPIDASKLAKKIQDHFIPACENISVNDDYYSRKQDIIEAFNSLYTSCLNAVIEKTKI